MEETHRFMEINNFQLLTCLKYIAIVTSLVNVTVFARIMRRQYLLQYMFFMSISDALFTLGLTPNVPLSSWCFHQELNKKSEDNDIKMCLIFYWYVYLIPNYLTSCLSLSNIMVEILVTCQRIWMISKEARSSEKAARPFLVCLLIFALALAVYAPVLFMRIVVSHETRNETTGSVRREYFYNRTEFGRSTEALFVEKSLSTTRVFLVSVVLTVVNIIAYVKYNSFFKRKMDMTRKQSLVKVQKVLKPSPSRKLTMMLIVVSFLYIFGNIPHLVSYMIRLVYKERVVWLARASQCSMYLLIILKTFVYYYFNSVFSRIVNNFFVKCFCFWSKNYSVLVQSHASMPLGE